MASRELTRAVADASVSRVRRVLHEHCEASKAHDEHEASTTSEAPPWAASPSHLSPLAHAALAGSLEIVELLLEAGALADEPSGRAQATPLSLAAREGHRAICEVLLARGADASLRDAYGLSPIDYAARRATAGSTFAREYGTWTERIEERAAAFALEPPPAPPPCPLSIRDELHGGAAAASAVGPLWRAGRWMHERYVPTRAVQRRREPRPFSATGLGAQPPRVDAADAERLRLPAADEVDDAALAAIALERARNNPLLPSADARATNASAKEGYALGAALLRGAREHEATLTASHPNVPVRYADGAELYLSERLKEAFPVGTAAATTVAIVEARGTGGADEAATEDTEAVAQDAAAHEVEGAGGASDGDSARKEPEEVASGDQGGGEGGECPEGGSDEPSEPLGTVGSSLGSKVCYGVPRETLLQLLEASLPPPPE